MSTGPAPLWSRSSSRTNLPTASAPDGVACVQGFEGTDEEALEADVEKEVRACCGVKACGFEPARLEGGGA